MDEVKVVFEVCIFIDGFIIKDYILKVVRFLMRELEGVLCRINVFKLRNLVLVVVLEGGLVLKSL